MSKLAQAKSQASGRKPFLLHSKGMQHSLGWDWEGRGEQKRQKSN
jgi:hypothetical protein